MTQALVELLKRHEAIWDEHNHAMGVDVRHPPSDALCEHLSAEAWCRLYWEMRHCHGQLQAALKGDPS
jgi:hypothetical protein